MFKILEADVNVIFDGNREIVTIIDGTGINFVVIKLPDGDIADGATLWW